MSKTWFLFMKNNVNNFDFCIYLGAPGLSGDLLASMLLILAPAN